ncbi:MAG: signal peptidase II [Leucobacter sp.]|nr:signal peptidase II [Leucobacter sp.]
MKPGGHRAQALALLSIAVVVYVLDQLTKNWVVAHLPEGRVVPVMGDVLQWFFVRNPGAAFSMASGATWLFTLLAVVVVGAIIWQIRHLGSRSWAVFFALLLGGVLGNLTDRLTRDPGFPVGHVIDFISTPWLIPAIYNVADIAIVSAMCLFVLITLLGLPIDGSPRPRKATAEAPDSSEVDETSETAETAETDQAVEAAEAAEVAENEASSDEGRE